MRNIALGLGLLSTFLATAQMVVRTPALHPNGVEMAFSYQGDIWSMQLDGSGLKRLTIHEGYESHPLYHPSGEQLAFASYRFGHSDVFVMSSDGGQPKRLTFHSANDQASSWTKDDRLLFNTNRHFSQVDWDGEVHIVSAKGGTPYRFLNATGESAVESPDGRYIAYVKGACRMEREAYRGPADTEIWLYDTKQETHRQLTDNEGNEVLPKWKDNAQLFFIHSDAKGVYNIASLNITEAQPKIQVLTKFTQDGVQHFDLQGNKIVLERMEGIYVIENVAAQSKPVKINIQIPTDFRFDPMEMKNAKSGMEEYVISPDGKALAFVLHGEVFVKGMDEKKDLTYNVSNHPYRESEVVWVNDSLLLFTSDRTGFYNIYAVRSIDAKRTRLEKSLKHEVVAITSGKEDISKLSISPDRKKLIYVVGGTKVMLANVSDAGKLSGEKMLFSHWDGASNISWSPDSRYIAYDQSDLTFNSEVFILPIDGKSEAVNVSMHPRGDYGAVWSPDGSKLGFLSSRNNGDYDVWYVWLKREDWLKTKQDREEGYYFVEEDSTETKEDKKEEKKDDKKPKPVVIDFDDIHDRLQQVTSFPGSEGQLVISRDGETFYFSAQNLLNDRSNIYKIKFDGSDITELTSGGQGYYGLELLPGGDDLSALRNGMFYTLDHKKGSATNYPFEAKYTLDHRAENEQVFEEAWKLIQQRFYDPNFHNTDWKSVKARYKPYALSASTSQDFRHIFNNMLGQINASHMGLYGGNPEDVSYQRSGLLGIEVMPVKGGLEVTYVLPNGPADREKSKLKVGDVITAIAGTELKEEVNLYDLLNNQVDQQLLLEYKRGGKSNEIAIRPARSTSEEEYEAWVEMRRELTEKYSKGRLGYIHIKGMDKPSFERFERELQASGKDKEGIVIDVRFNGGGWTTDYLMAVLSVRQHAYTIPRGAADNLEKEHPSFSSYYPYSERLPLSAWVKPSIAMCNSYSYSNAEIFSHAYKSLDIGTLVGEPTFGAVISTGGAGLLDGSFIRIPFRAWYVKESGMNMENGPAVPDMIVEAEPGERAQGEDGQLKAACEQLLSEIEAK